MDGNLDPRQLLSGIPGEDLHELGELSLQEARSLGVHVPRGATSCAGAL